MITLNNLPFNVRKYFPTSSSQPQVPKNFAFLFQWSGAHSTLLKELRNGIFLSISVNSGYHNHQGLQPSNMSQWASETQGWKQYLSSDYRHSLKWAQYTQDVKTQYIDLRKLLVHIKGLIFSEPRLLHLPIHSKVVNSLTWYIYFFLFFLF